jgi:hypothetical protein
MEADQEANETAFCGYLSYFYSINHLNRSGAGHKMNELMCMHMASTSTLW